MRTLLARVAGALTWLSVAAPALAAPAAPPPPAERVPPVYEMALPSRIAFVAWLPAARAPDAVDLDLRVEVVLPMRCGDTVAGLLRAGGPSLDGPDHYEVVIERRAIAKCVKEPTRIGARAALRMRLPEGQRRELVIGGQALSVERKAGAVTLDGAAPEGDVPGAPPTGRPTTLVTGEASAATLVKAARDATEPDSARATLHVTARWPACAGAPLGLLGRGDAATRFTLTRFQPIAVAPLDQPCKGKPAVKGDDVETVLHLGRSDDKATISVGSASVTIPVGAPPAQRPSAPPAAAPPAAAPAAPGAAPPAAAGDRR